MPIRVLLVDDSAVVRDLLRSVFQSDAAFEVIGAAKNGSEAVRQVRRERPGLIVMDLEMPLMGGVDCRARRPAAAVARRAPVRRGRSASAFATCRSSPSPRASDEDRRRGIEAGADAYIVKGDFDQSRLIETLKSLLG